MAPPKAWQKEKMTQFAAFCIIKKKFPGGLPPDPPNSPIYFIFLAFDANGPHQCERLELPVSLMYFDIKDVPSKYFTPSVSSVDCFVSLPQNRVTAFLSGVGIINSTCLKYMQYLYLDCNHLLHHTAKNLEHKCHWICSRIGRQDIPHLMAKWQLLYSLLSQEL